MSFNSEEGSGGREEVSQPPREGQVRAAYEQALVGLGRAAIAARGRQLGHGAPTAAFGRRRGKGSACSEHAVEIRGATLGMP